MKTYRLVHTFGNVIAEGSKEQIEFTYKAFQNYGIGDHKYEIEEVEEKKYGLTDSEIDEMYSNVLDWMTEVNNDSSCMSDLLSDGVKGLADHTLEELVDLAEQSDLVSLKHIVDKYRANKAVESEILDRNDG